MKCRDRIAFGRCGRDVLPGMGVCVERASHGAIEMRMRQMAAVDDAARVARDKLRANSPSYGTPETKAALKALEDVLGRRE